MYDNSKVHEELKRLRSETQSVQPVQPAEDSVNTGYRQPVRTVRDYDTKATDYSKAYGIGSGRMVTSLGKGVEMFGKLLPGLDEEEYSPTKKAIIGAGETVQDVGETASKYWESSLSEGAKTLKNAAWFEAPGMFNKLKAASLQAVESAPETIAIGLTGAPISAAAKGVGVARGLTSMLAKTGLSSKAATRGARWIVEGMSYGVPEGVMAGLYEAKQLSDEVDAMSHDQLMKSPLYQDYVKENPETARERLKETLELSTLLTTTALSTGFGAVAGGGIFGDALNPAMGGMKGFLARRVVGAGKEGFQEFWQEGFGEQLASNIVTKLALNPDRKLMDKVLYSGAAGAGPGALMGLVAGSGVGGQRETLEERIKNVSDEVRKENLAKVIKADLPTEELENLLAAPQMLYERGLVPSDIEGIIKNRDYDEMSIANMDATVQSVLENVPNAETKEGFLTSIVTKTLEKQTADEEGIPEDFKSEGEFEDTQEPDTVEPVAEAEVIEETPESIQESEEIVDEPTAAEESDQEVAEELDRDGTTLARDEKGEETTDQDAQTESTQDDAGLGEPVEVQEMRTELKSLLDTMEKLGGESTPKIVYDRALELSNELAKIDKQPLDEPKQAVEEEKEEASTSKQAPIEEPIRDELEPEVIEADEVKTPKEEVKAEVAEEEDIPYTQDEVDYLNRKREMLKKDLFEQQKEGNKERAEKIQTELDQVETNYKEAAEVINREKSHTPENVAYMERELTKLRGEQKLLTKQGKTQRAAKVQERIDVLQNNYEEATATLQRTAQATLKQIPLKEQEIAARIQERDELIAEGKTERAEAVDQYIQEQQQAVESSKAIIGESRVRELKDKEVELQAKIDKAVKGKKKVSHLRKEMAELQKEITDSQKQTLASRKRSKNKFKSTPQEVEKNVLDSLGLKKAPKIVQVVRAYEDLPKEVRDAFEKEQGLASRKIKGKWSSRFNLDFINKKAANQTKPVNEWLKDIKRWQKNMPPTVQEELIFSGLEDWLSTLDQDKVTSAEIADFMSRQLYTYKEETIGEVPRHLLYSDAAKAFAEIAERWKEVQNEIDRHQAAFHNVLWQRAAYAPETQLGDFDDTQMTLDFIESDLLDKYARMDDLYRMDIGEHISNWFGKSLNDIIRKDHEVGKTLIKDLQFHRDKWLLAMDEMKTMAKDFRTKYNRDLTNISEWVWDNHIGVHLPKPLIPEDLRPADYENMTLQTSRQAPEYYRTHILDMPKVKTFKVLTSDGTLVYETMDMERAHKFTETVPEGYLGRISGATSRKDLRISIGEASYSEHSKVSSHFGTNNLLHIRATHREAYFLDDVNWLSEMLFVHEIQSDVMQKAKNGLTTETMKEADYESILAGMEAREEFEKWLVESFSLGEMQSLFRAFINASDRAGWPRIWTEEPSKNLAPAIAQELMNRGKVALAEWDSWEGTKTPLWDVEIKDVFEYYRKDLFEPVLDPINRTIGLKEDFEFDLKNNTEFAQKFQAWMDAYRHKLLVDLQPVKQPFMESWEMIAMKRMLQQAVMEGKGSIGFPMQAYQVAEIEQYGYISTPYSWGALAQIVTKDKNGKPQLSWVRGDSNLTSLQHQDAYNADPDSYKNLGAIFDRYTNPNRLVKKLNKFLKKYNTKVQPVVLEEGPQRRAFEEKWQLPHARAHKSLSLMEMSYEDAVRDIRSWHPDIDQIMKDIPELKLRIIASDLHGYTVGKPFKKGDTIPQGIRLMGYLTSSIEDATKVKETLENSDNFKRAQKLLPNDGWNVLIETRGGFARFYIEQKWGDEERIDEVWGIEITKSLEDAIKDGLPLASLAKEEEPRALYHEGQIYLIADNIDPDVDIRGLLIHEGGHWLRRNDPAYEQRYKHLIEQFRNIGRSPLGSADMLAVQRAYAMASLDAHRLPPDMVEEEALMYFLQEESNAELPFYKKVVSFIKQFLFKHFNVAPAKLNMSGYDMAQIVANDIKAVLDESNESIANIEKEMDDVALSTRVKNSKPAEDFTTQQETLDRIFSTSATQDAGVTRKQLIEAQRAGIDAAMMASDKEVSKAAQDLHKAVQSVAFKRDEKNQNTGFWYRLFSSPEYSFRKDPAAAEVLKHGIYADELKYRTQQRILENFELEAVPLKKEDPEAYQRAASYLRRVDKTGKGWRLKFVEDKNQWRVVNPKGKIEATHTDRWAAADDLINREYEANTALPDNARKFVRLFRELMDRSLRAQTEDLQRQINNAKRFGLREPTIPRSDTITLSDAITASGDLQGTYFPRIRPNKEWVLRAEKEGSDPITETFQFYYPENTVFTVEDWIAKKINKALPISRRIKALQKEGYTVTGIDPRNTPSEVVFDTAGILNSLDALLGKAEEGLETEEDFELMKNLNDLLTAEIANVYKAKGNLSNRLKRSENFTAGFEEDPIKAAIMHAQRTAAGVAKRETARNMLLAATGRDISYDEWAEGQEDPTQKEYRKFVNNRKIDPTNQKAMYADVRTYMQHVLRPNQAFEKAVGYAKSFAVLWFLGFRVSSAAVNSTNMVLAVPATIAAHTRTSITKAYAEVADAAAKYTAHRSEQLTFRGAKNSVIDEAWYLAKLGAKGVGKTITAPVKLTDDERHIFEQITERGWDEAHFNIDATRAVQDYGSQAYNTLISGSMYLFGAAEKANRAMTIFAAYKTIAKKEGVKGFNEDVLQRAKHASDRAHGVYGKATKPWLVQQFSFLDLPYTFMKFQHNYILNMIEMGFNKETWKSGLHMLLAPAAVSGLGASLLFSDLPVIKQAMDAAMQGIAAMFGADTDDPEEDFYAWAESWLPDWADQVPRHGLLGLANVNFKGSLEMNMAFPEDIFAVGGAPVGVAQKWYDAAQFGMMGEYQKGFESFLPVAAGNPVKAQRLYDEGLTTTSGYAPIFYGQEQLKATGYETALMTLGFNPARLSGIREKIYRERLVVAEYAKRRQEIARRARKYIQTDVNKRSPRDLEKIKELWQDYNFDVSKAPARYNLKILTSEKLNNTIEQSMRPSKAERLR